MKDSAPWSVEGVDPEARQAADAAAAEAGVSLGTWLSHVVRQSTGPGKAQPRDEALIGAVESLGLAVAEMSTRLDSVAPRRPPAKQAASKSRGGRLVGILAVLTVVLLGATYVLVQQILYPGESERVVATMAELSPELTPDSAADLGVDPPAEAVVPDAGPDTLGPEAAGSGVGPNEAAAVSQSPSDNQAQDAAATDLSPEHANRELAWLKDSAERGVVGAQLRLGLAYLAGREGVARDYGDAHFWLELAAAQRSAEALFQLGVMHEKGLGVAPSDEAAALWYEQATALDHPAALHNLAVMQAQGRGVSQDYLVAAELFSRAAERNLAISQYNLGVLHETGRGVELDLLEAYRWYSLAAKQGNRGAVERRDAVAAQLMPDELALAQQLVADWRPLASDTSDARLPASDLTADRDDVIIE